ncbi:MAG TPA: methyltransferase domain-containing protein [Acidimicrobiales bacterium]|nr:methyltransferase domain-containing protein [Acidimicrobiales bacterium]
MGPNQAVRIAYNVILKREPDPGGQSDFVARLKARAIDHDELIDWLRGSEEFATVSRLNLLGPSLHLSRCEFIRSLPRARRILDLGGTHLAKAEGAFVAMGYPYRFEELVIVDLPTSDRHEIYRAQGDNDKVETHLGPVRYSYHSMADLSRFADESFDLVYSGQSIEHVNEETGDLVLSEVRRVLRRGGFLALDTPNGRVTRLQQDSFIDPDHEVEYTDAELRAKLDRAGFDIAEAKGLNYAGSCLDRDVFSMTDVAGHQGMFAEIDECYLLAYVCRKR